MGDIERVWAKVSLAKVSKFPLYLCILFVLSFFIQRFVDRMPIIDNGLSLLGAIIFFIYLGSFFWKVIITTNSKGLKIRGSLKDRFIKWEEISRCLISEIEILIFPKANLLPIRIDLKLIQDKASFIELLKNKIEFLKEDEVNCLKCGAPIKPGEKSCSNCNWSWEDKKNSETIPG